MAPYLSNFKRSDADSSEIVMVEFSVSDNGVGILPDDQKRLFQAFSQIRPGDLQVGRGSGLGLCICKRTVEMMGGSIGVRSTLGKGSTFFIALPLLVSSSPNNALNDLALDHQEQQQLPTSVVAQHEPQQLPPRREAATKQRGTFKKAATPATRSSSSSSSLSSSSIAADTIEPTPTTTTTGLPAETSHLESKKSSGEGQGLRVLIVDDVEMNRKLVARFVRKLPGFVCEEAKDGVEAVELAAERRCIYIYPLLSYFCRQKRVLNVYIKGVECSSSLGTFIELVPNLIFLSTQSCCRPPL
jgi:CheY-like chemotaxis protein